MEKQIDERIPQPNETGTKKVLLGAVPQGRTKPLTPGAGSRAVWLPNYQVSLQGTARLALGTSSPLSTPILLGDTDPLAALVLCYILCSLHLPVILLVLLCLLPQPALSAKAL